jgi:hypothetical protein
MNAGSTTWMLRLAPVLVLLAALPACDRDHRDERDHRDDAPLPGDAVASPAGEPRHALLGFFSALRDRRYSDAVTFYGGSYEVLEGWNPHHDPRHRAGLWQAACEGNGLECFHDVEVLGEQESAPGEYHFTVRFLTPAGGVWTLGPCCGETEETMPPVSEFTFTVRRAGEDFRVHTLPVYVP